MKKVFLTIFLSAIIISAITLSSYKKSSVNAGLSGTVTGVVKDTKGKPIAGAKVRIENDFAYYDVTTNANGRYTCFVKSIGSFKAVAWAPIKYWGKTYNLRMGMPNEEDYDFFDPRKGAVKNFQMQISGRIPDRDIDENSTAGYFGLGLELRNGTGSIYDARLNPGEQVALVMDPKGPLMDGSTGKRVERVVTVPPGNESMYVPDIPLGAYTLYAFVDRNGQWQPLKVGTFSRQGNSMDILGEPDTYGQRGNYESGVRRVVVHLAL